MSPVVQAKGLEQVTTRLRPRSPRVNRSIYGYSVFNRSSGEAYLVEVVMNDLSIPDQLPDPTTNVT